ncbi:MAG: 40S ribosomal protein S19 [Nanoarchaeota archaeon]
MDKLITQIKKTKEIKAPEWAAFVKTGSSKERPPVQEDWWQVRAASILMKINKYGPIGTNRLAKHYGSRKNRGYKPDIKYAGSRNIVRKIIQQLDKAGLIQLAETQKKGRVVTKTGREFIKKVEQ